MKILEWIWKNSKELHKIAAEEFAEECPNRDNCSENFMENYEPQHDESRD